ncbi:ABC transporter permease [Halonatronum saccharophilum]|uniref:ABC transporter permease n=1 Tax=Halonatronum saccharophilum TaxID=150060 RepID=UPI0004810485|nr:FtsX-like permease family protein [Halonatronum saccharophilum]
MFKIALRNILRNKRRTLLSLIIIVISTTFLFLAIGYVEDTYQGLKWMEVARNGYFQVAKEGFWDLEDSKRRLLSRDDIVKIEEIFSGEEDIRDYTPTLGLTGILGTEDNSIPVFGEGIELDSESSIMIESGTNLFFGDRARILLGSGVKKQLNVDIDEWVSIMTTTPQGAYSARSLKVTGGFSTGSSMADNNFVIIPIGFAQEILNVDGVDKFKVTLNENAQLEEIVNNLEKDFEEAGLSVEVKSWLDLAEAYYQIKGLYDMVFLFLAVIIFVLVFFSILEIMSMSFFERMNEIGTIRAIGTRRSQVFSQLFQEALILGVIGGLLGIICGFGLGSWINGANLTYLPPDASQEVPFAINMAVKNGIIPFFLVLISTGLSALYPAFKAARLNVVETLRYV